MVTAKLLVGGFNHIEKYYSMGRIIPYIMENKKCSKPPIRIGSIYPWIFHGFSI